MKIVGTGIDVIEINRFRDAVKKYGKMFLEKIFTDSEIEYSKKRRFQYQHFAARFASKEAVIKAFGDAPNAIAKWTDIEIINDTNGKPSVKFHGSAEKLKKQRKINDVVISMSHSRTMAVANAILVSNK